MYKRNNQGWIKHIDFILWDALTLEIVLVLAYFIRHRQIVPYNSDIYKTLAFTLFFVDFLIAAIFNTMHNVLKRSYLQELVQTIKQVFLIFIFTLIYMFSFQKGEEYSRIVIYLMSFLHLIVGYMIRLSWKSVILKRPNTKPKSSMILVADESKLSGIFDKVKNFHDFEYSGIVLSNRDGTGEVLFDTPVVASLDTAADYICREWVDEVFIYPEHLTDIEGKESVFYDMVEQFVKDSKEEFKEYINQRAMKDYSSTTVADLIESCRQMAIPVHIRLPISNIGSKTFVEKVGGYSVLTTAINYASPLQLLMKRMLDILGGLIGSIIAIVVIAVLTPIIKKESPGPVLYKQTRIGLNGKRFKILKIRSMYLDADERKEELMKDNRVSDGMMFKLDFDPRIIGNKIVDGKQVTGIGEKIRSGSWDEWPQFFNILMGHMSLVGTRPPTEDEWEKYKYHHRARLATKPGLTGMWQVSGRSKITDFEEVVKLDTEYINHWSIVLDIKILLKTVKSVLKKDGAM